VRISVIDPLGRAWNRMVLVLFTPFELGKWCTLGFCAFLAQLGQGGTNYSFRWTQNMQRFPFEDIHRWVLAHLALVVALAAVVVVLSLALGVVLKWLAARGQFMFLDGVVKNRGAVVEPWHQFRSLGNSLFWVRLVLGVSVGLASLAIIALGVLLAWTDIRARHFGPHALAAVIVCAALLVLLILVFILINALLLDFVVPIMYRRSVRTMEAASIFRHEIVPNHLGVIILFYLLKIAIGIGLVPLAILVTCCTCCIAGLPYISSVVFLPVSVFFRSYSICFLEQFGPQWRFFDAGSVPLTAPSGEGEIAPAQPV